MSRDDASGRAADQPGLRGLLRDGQLRDPAGRRRGRDRASGPGAVIFQLIGIGNGPAHQPLVPGWTLPVIQGASGAFISHGVIADPLGRRSRPWGPPLSVDVMVTGRAYRSMPVPDLQLVNWSDTYLTDSTGQWVFTIPDAAAGQVTFTAHAPSGTADSATVPITASTTIAVPALISH